MPFDPMLVLAGLITGVMVGLTGMGGGALMTPMLVILFGVNPLTAVGSDLVVSLFMKPVGGLVHVRHGTVRWDIVRWLAAGSVVGAFGGAFLLDRIGADQVGPLLRHAIGVALLATAATMALRPYLQRNSVTDPDAHEHRVRPLLTLVIGLVGGVLVGMTSVGSGSLIVVLLLLAYPALSSAELVGTDLVQAIPLVASAALGHYFFGDISFGLVGSLLIGAIPGAFIGAQFSARAPSSVVRPALFVILFSTGLKLVQVI
jgi:uncharacterized membrane protein YfcA